MTPPDENPPLKAAYDRIYPGGPESRRRDRLWTVGIALVVSALFGAAASLYITTVVQHRVRSDALQAAQHNCKSLRTSRLQGNAFRFAVREEFRIIPDSIAESQRHKQKITPEGAAFLATEIARLNTDLAAERRKGTPGLPDHITGFGDLFGLFADTAPINCAQATLLDR